MTICKRATLKASFSKANRMITTLALRSADFGFLRDMLGRITWDVVLERRGFQEISLIFSDYMLQAQEQSFPMCRKPSKDGTRCA